LLLRPERFSPCPYIGSQKNGVKPWTGSTPY